VPIEGRIQSSPSRLSEGTTDENLTSSESLSESLNDSGSIESEGVVTVVLVIKVCTSLDDAGTTNPRGVFQSQSGWRTVVPSNIPCHPTKEKETCRKA
jgi:hypothetical protein